MDSTQFFALLLSEYLSWEVFKEFRIRKEFPAQGELDQ